MHPSRSARRRRFDIASQIFEIEGDAEHPRKLVAGLRIEIGVTAACVDRTVSDANIRQARGLVSANRDVAGDIGHEVVDAGVPFQLEHRREIRKAPCRIADVVGQRPEGALLPHGHRGHAGQGPCQTGADDAIARHEGHRGLAAEHRRRNVEDGTTKPRLAIASIFKFRLALSVTLAGTLLSVNSRAPATSAPAETEVW